jgi:hypothetical protein
MIKNTKNKSLDHLVIVVAQKNATRWQNQDVKQVVSQKANNNQTPPTSRVYFRGHFHQESSNQMAKTTIKRNTFADERRDERQDERPCWSNAKPSYPPGQSTITQFPHLWYIKEDIAALNIVWIVFQFLVKATFL